MREARKRIPAEIKTGRIQEAMARYCLGRDTTKRIAAEAGAVIKVGKAWLCDFDRMDAYMESKAGGGASESQN